MMEFCIQELVSDGQIQLPPGSWRLKCSWSNEPQELEFTNHSTNDKLFRWYLEEFTTKDPLSTRKASVVVELLAQYQKKIQSLLQGCNFEHHADRIILDVLDHGGKSSFHAIPWELLEDCSQDQQIVVRRRSQTNDAPLPDDKIHCQPESFNILLLAARSDSDDQAEYSQAALPIIELLERLPPGSSTVTLDIVRPGTFAALRSHLVGAKKRNKQYQLVHLDVHGTVKKKFALLHYADEEVPAQDVAKLLREHEIIYSVINACESAKAGQNPGANLAKVFTQTGIPHVFAMSFKLQINAVRILLDAFYGSFLRSGKNFAESAAVARKAMREIGLRTGKFGIELDLKDWIVPVVYSSSEIDIGVQTLNKIASSQNRPWHSWLGRKQGGLPELPSLQGRDRDVLKLENKLLENETNGRGRLLLLSGKSGCGKTSLLQFLQRWWYITGWTLDPIYVDMEACRIDTPDQLCKFIYRKYARKGLASLKDSGDRPLHVLLQDLYDAQEGPEQTKKRPFLILDHLPRVYPITPWKKKDIDSFSVKANIWKSFLADLSSAAAYTIVTSYDFPWYIDDHPRTDWPWETFHILQASKTSFPSLDEHKTGNRTMREILERPRNTEMLEMVLRWSEDCFPLHQAMGILLKDSGLETTVRNLQTNVDLLTCPAFNSSVIRSQKVFGVAAELWKHCSDIEKSILLSFSPFHGCLPRCYESYARDFCLGKLEMRRPVRDWLLKRAPQPSVDNYWATVNRSKASLVNLEAHLLIVRLKKAGLIQAVAMCAPTHMDDDLDPLLRNRAEGVKIHSIHPVFTIFLRHQAARTGYGRFGDKNEGAQLLTRIFVEHHDLRVYEWLQELGAGSKPWDTYIESLLERQNFVAALEQKFQNGPQMKQDMAPVPPFLAWCLMTCNGSSSQFVTTGFSPDVIAEYCTKAWPYAVDKVSQVASADYFTLAITLTPIFQITVFFLSRYLLSNNTDRFRQTLADLDEVLKAIPHDISLLCVHGPGDDLKKLVEAVEKLRQCGHGQGTSSFLTFCELAPAAPERNQVLTEGWTIIEQCISVYRDATTLFESDEAFSFWDQDTLGSEVRGLTATADSIFATLAPSFKEFLMELDDKTRASFQMFGFTQAEKVGQIDPENMALLQHWKKDGLIPPNYPSIVMDNLQLFRALSEAHAEFDRAQSVWLNKKKQRSSQLTALNMLHPASRLDNDSGLTNHGAYGTGLFDNVTIMSFEESQVKSFVLMDDYQSLKEYLDLVAVEPRTTPLDCLDAAQLRHRIWWHNVNAICDFKLKDWRSAQRHSSEAVRLAQSRPAETTRIMFSALRLRMMMYNSCLDRTVFEDNDHEIPGADSYWMVLLTALILGYQSSEKIYARNGVLFTLLIQAASKEKVDAPNSVPADVLHSTISATIEHQRPLELGTDLFQSIESLRSRQGNTISHEFLNVLQHHLLAAASDIEASRAIMKEAEAHVFRHGGQARSCGCRFAGDGQRQQQKFQTFNLEGLIPLLPCFDRLDYRVEIPCMGGIWTMIELWLGNKFKTQREEWDVKKILENLGQWHSAARD